jgi:hypothetical protein
MKDEGERMKNSSLVIFHLSFDIFHLSSCLQVNYLINPAMQNGKWKMENDKWKMENENDLDLTI